MKHLYKSFWMGGFEGADHVNARAVYLDMVKDSGHLDSLEADYKQLADLGIYTVRESVGWRASQPSLDAPLDLSRTIARAEAARVAGIQIVWTFMHYGTPDGVDFRDDEFIDHFVRYAIEVARALKPYDEAPIFNLINEISFLAWATSQTDYMWPYKPSSSREGYLTKCRLVLATLAAMAAIRERVPKARFLHVEPVMHVVAPVDRPDLEELAQEVRSHQWQTWELLKGTMEPQLGGYPEALDLMGVNYYFNGQMEIETDNHLDWQEPDPRRVPFRELLQEVWERYQRPLIISETSHFDDERSQWLDYVLSETKQAMDQGVPIEGLCIYPITDRPCWHEPTKIIRCGLLDHPESIEALKRWQKELA